jgi:sugar/nucleoside kinase (ribokinase family)
VHVGDDVHLGQARMRDFDVDQGLRDHAVHVSPELQDRVGDQPHEAEITELAGESDFDAAVAAIAPQVATLVVTRSEKGAIAVAGDERASVPAEPIERLVDTTGAGDLFAAGFLAGQARGLSLEVSLKLGAIAAAEVIQHYGARPEADLKALAGSLLG